LDTTLRTASFSYPPRAGIVTNLHDSPWRIHHEEAALSVVGELGLAFGTEHPEELPSYVLKLSLRARRRADSVEALPGISVDPVADRATHLDRADSATLPVEHHRCGGGGLNSNQAPLLVEHVDSASRPSKPHQTVVAVVNHAALPTAG
jgi:hypothetical protein